MQDQVTDFHTLMIIHLFCLFMFTVTVERADTSDGKQSKVDYCFYCNCRYRSNISKHYLAIHSSEVRVKKIIDMQKTSTARKKALIRLQNEGNFKHNMKVLRKNLKQKNCRLCVNNFIINSASWNLQQLSPCNNAPNACQKTNPSKGCDVYIYSTIKYATLGWK